MNYEQKTLLTSGLVSYWPFHEKSGLVADDRKDRANGSITGTVTRGSDNLVRDDNNFSSFDLDGITGRVSIKPLAAYTSGAILNTMSIDLVAMPDALPASGAASVLFGQKGSFLAFINPDGSVSFTVYPATGSAKTATTAAGLAVVGERRHWSFRFNRTANLVINRDGVEVASTANTGSVARKGRTDYVLQAGALVQTSAVMYSGKIQELAIFNTYLSDATVQARAKDVSAREVALNIVSTSDLVGEPRIRRRSALSIVSTSSLSSRYRVRRGSYPEWRFELAHSGSMETIGELSGARDRSLDLMLNQGGSFGFTLATHNEMAQHVKRMATCVKAIRDNELVWSGPVWNMARDGAARKLTVNAVGWFQYLMKRFIFYNQVADQPYQQMDGGEIIFKLLDKANERGVLLPGAPSTTFMTRGTRQQSAPRTRTYKPEENIKQLIDELINIENGVDLWVDPLTRQMNIYYPKFGFLKNTVHWGYNWGPHNLFNATVSEDTDQHKNAMLVRGQYGSAYAEDVANQAEYGLLEDVGSLSDVAGDFHTVTITGSPTGGVWWLTFKGETTDAIAWNATAATVQARLEALSTIGTAKAFVSGGPAPNNPFRVTLSVPTEELTGGHLLTGGTSPGLTITRSNILLAFAGAEVAVGLNPIVFEVFPKPWTPDNALPRPFYDFNLGDTVKFSYKDDTKTIDHQNVRIFGITIGIDNQGNERLSSVKIRNSG